MEANKAFPHIFEKGSGLKNITKLEALALLKHKAMILENLTERVSNLSYIQQTINCKLKYLCQSNSNSFDVGMKKVRTIMTEMQDIRSSIANNKKVLG